MPSTNICRMGVTLTFKMETTLLCSIFSSNQQLARRKFKMWLYNHLNKHMSKKLIQDSSLTLSKSYPRSQSTSSSLWMWRTTTSFNSGSSNLRATQTISKWQNSKTLRSGTHKMLQSKGIRTNLRAAITFSNFSWLSNSRLRIKDHSSLRKNIQLKDRRRVRRQRRWHIRSSSW